MDNGELNKGGLQADTLTQAQKEENIHGVRKAISGIIDRVLELRAMPEYGNAGRELSLVITKLQEAKMWGGQTLGAIGKELPADYPVDNAE